MTRRETLIAYLLSSVEAEDWHAVRDAAVDIEVLDARGQRFEVKHATGAVYTPENCPCIKCQEARERAKSPSKSSKEARLDWGPSPQPISDTGWWKP